jgi:CBS domain-containing protein/uncharacterized protein (DUF2267 family)
MISLGWYVRPRLVALRLDSSVLEGARAIENNNIGAVIVHDAGRVVGIVTDRDLTVRVVGRGLDPRATTLAEVMTRDVATLSSHESRTDALRLMLERNIRRIPLVDDGRLVGIVTLDDLLLDEAAPIDRLAEVVEAQLGEGGPATPQRSHGRKRRGSRAEATYRRLLNEVRRDANLETVEQAETALEVVVGALVRRLTPDEAKDLISQLPSALHPSLQALPPGPDKRVTRESIEADLVECLDLDPARATELLANIGATISRKVSSGQMEDVHGQLPGELRSVFSTLTPAAP